LGKHRGIETLIADLKMPIHPSPARDIIADCVRKWMLGLQLDERESAIVDAALIVNKADQILRCMEGSAS
jgi:hypothetical protein